MSETLFMRRSLSGLQATDTFGAEALARLPLNEDVKVVVTRPRNLKMLRKFFKLLETVFPHQSVYPTLKSFRGGVEIALGFGETFKLPDGRTIILPESISFSNMEQEDFDKLYDRAVDLIVTRILPGVDKADLTREVDDIIAGPRGVPTYATEGVR